MSAPTATTPNAPQRVEILDVPGASLYFEVRGSGPLMVLVGAPMDADSFTSLADFLATDHTVLTTDPRGVHRSRVDDRDQDSTPEMRADDLARLIAFVDAGPAIVFGSSGGAVTALALAQARPDLVRSVVAHEPPLIELLEDRDELRARTEAYCAAYLAGDVVGAWRQFLATANIAMPDDVVEQMFGGERDPEQVATERHWFAHELRPSSFWRPDLTALRDGPTQIIVGVGEASTGEECDRTSAALATALDLDRAVFPGGHIAFAEDPAGFAPRLRAVLADTPHRTEKHS